MDKSGTIWSNQDLFRQPVTFLDQYIPIWIIRDIIRPIQPYMDQVGPKLTYLYIFGPIIIQFRTNQDLFGPLTNVLNKSRLVWIINITFIFIWKQIRSCLKLTGPSWTNWDPSGIIKTIWPIMTLVSWSGPVKTN